MKAKIITESRELATGFKLGGIGGELVFDREQALEAFETFSKQEDLALIILSRKTYLYIEKEVRDFKKQNKCPLLVVLD